ncbi:MAG: chemotaxis protein [Syntrophomonadaceae bacterium]|nr:chemotaxis protein [Syntrophomonadaceae bacterium]
MTSIGIVGGGKGGSSVLRAFSGISEFQIVGVCDVNADAPGIKLARELGVPVYTDIGALLQTPALNIVIEATGSGKVKETILATKQEQTLLIDSQVANVIMTLTESHDQMVERLHSKKEAFKTSAPLLVQTYERGVIYFTTDLERYDFVLSKGIEIPGIKVGERIVAGGYVARCIATKKDVIGLVDAKVYGMPLNIWIMPVFAGRDSGEVIGTCGVMVPHVHPVAAGFDIFAPIMIQSQLEGAQVMITDREKVTHSLASDKFKIHELGPGSVLREGDAGTEVLKRRTPIVRDINSRKYGPFRITGVPLYDENGEVVGTFGILVPRKLAQTLREMAARLTSNTQEAASVMEEIAASANEININEGHLAEVIREVQDISGQINDILNFIRKVADQTKMLGLNAAIEAARAGEHGRSFGVVAEEIRKLSDQSKETAEQIRKLTADIETKVTIAAEASQGSVRQSQEQAAATQEATAAVTEMADLASKLAEVAGSL